MSAIEIFKTSDGSHSLLHTELNETYHSRHGARTESQYVFIEKGLDYFLSQSKQSTVNILEVGFGTGLNAWLTLQFQQRAECTIRYTTLEAFPLVKEIWNQLNYTEFDLKNFYALHASDWNKAVAINDSFVLEKIHTTLQATTFAPNFFNVVYYDAFAPNKQPEMWTRDLFEKVYDSMRSGGVLVTYCAKGQLKRDLKSVGFLVESLPGPPGKREMVRGIKP